MKTAKRYFLFKSEPGTYSFETLAKEKKTNWNGVRNYQARNSLKTCNIGDYALIYHSGDEKAIVGISQITKDAYLDLDPKKPGEWLQVDLKFIKTFTNKVPLTLLKSSETLKNLPLLKQSRLSCMEILEKDFIEIMKMGEIWEDFQSK